MISGGDDPVKRHDAAFGKQDFAGAIDHVDSALRKQPPACSIGAAIRES